MKYLLWVTASLLLGAACTTPNAKEEQSTVTYLQEEKLLPYVLGANDTVYSVSLVLYSDTNTTLAYTATLVCNGASYSDSMIFDVEANQTVNGQLIFSACRVAKDAQPTLTSQIKVLEN